MAHDGVEELLVAGRPRRRRPMIIVYAAATVTAGVLIVHLNLDSTRHPGPGSATPTALANAPVIPPFTDSVPSPPMTPTPGLCSPSAICTAAATTPHASAAISAAVRDALGTPTDLRITALARPAGFGKSAALVSRTITADVAAGRLQILVSFHDISPSLDPTVSAASVHFSNGFIDNFYVRAVFAQKSAGHSAVFSSALDRLVEDRRLVSR